jgi:hypothetical protein
MKNLPTAEEFLDNRTETSKGLVDNEIYIPFDDAIEAIIEFAKLHVEQALKEASENAEMKWVRFTDHDYEIDKDSILNSYPLENIK